MIPHVVDPAQPPININPKKIINEKPPQLSNSAFTYPVPVKIEITLNNTDLKLNSSDLLNIKYVERIIILAIIIIVMLNLLFPNRVLQVLINNINNIVILGILSLLIYILIFFLDKDKEYKDLRKFVEDRKVKLDNLMDTVNTKNTDIVNNHTSMQNEINNIGTSNVVGT